MEVSEKKIKISLDPFNKLHSDVHDYIFQHLRGRDVFNLFVVSKKWSQITGNSTVAMGKIRINIIELDYTRPPSQAYLTLLLKSQRKYLNLSTSFRYIIIFQLNLDLLIKLLPSLVELTFDGYGSPDLVKIRFPVGNSLPHLKLLSVKCENYSKIVIKILEKADNVENLSLNWKGKKKKIDTLVCSKKKLKTLKVYDKTCLTSLMSCSVPMQFKLTSLEVHRHNFYEESKMSNFILKMSQTLEYLNVMCLNKELAMSIHKLQKLKDLRFDFPDRDLKNDSAESFEPNTSIEHLTVSDSVQFIPDKFLSSLKGVRTISTFKIEKKDFVMIIEFMPRVEKIRGYSISLSCEECEEIYKKVRVKVPSDVRAIDVETREHPTRIPLGQHYDFELNRNRGFALRQY